MQGHAVDHDPSVPARNLLLATRKAALSLSRPAGGRGGSAQGRRANHGSGSPAASAAGELPPSDIGTIRAGTASPAPSTVDYVWLPSPAPTGGGDEPAPAGDPLPRPSH
jgi:hypothetical protein